MLNVIACLYFSFRIDRIDKVRYLSFIVLVTIDDKDIHGNHKNLSRSQRASMLNHHKFLRIWKLDKLDNLSFKVHKDKWFITKDLTVGVWVLFFIEEDLAFFEAILTEFILLILLWQCSTHLKLILLWLKNLWSLKKIFLSTINGITEFSLWISDEIFNEVHILPNAPFNYLILKELIEYLMLIVDVWLTYCNDFKLALSAA